MFASRAHNKNSRQPKLKSIGKELVREDERDPLSTLDLAAM